MKYIRFLVFFSFFTCFSLCCAVDDKDECKIRPLKGLKSIQIANITISCDNPEKLGLSEEKIKNTIELKLRMCGIDVESNIDDAAFVFVSIILIEDQQTSAAHVQIEIDDFATLERTQKLKLVAIWESCGKLLLYSDKAKLIKQIVEVIKEEMDEFSNLYLKANPRKFIEQPFESDLKSR